MVENDRGQLKKDDVDVAQQQELDADATLEEGEELGEVEIANQNEVNRVAMEIFSETPAFEPAPWLPREHIEALRHLYEAKGGEREAIGDGHVSGLQRMQSLNLALANLRPMLSSANELGEASEIDHELLGERVAELRLELKQTIYKEAVPQKKRDGEDRADDSGDEDDPDESSDDSDGSDGSDDESDGKRGSKRSRWKFWQKDSDSTDTDTDTDDRDGESSKE